MSDRILADLNPDQQRAVLHGEGPLMVLAGAGSGKTRVVTRRIARLIRDGVDRRRILAMTFTNKAAGEMARRVEELGGTFVRVSTFHSSCARFLRREASRIGFPADFSIYDTYDRDTCIKMLMGELGLDRYKVKPSHVGRHISKLKNLQVRPDDYVAGFSDLHRVTEGVYRGYEERMQKLGAMDFDDLLLRFLDLLREHPDVAERYQEQFPWLLVDEFQDTNKVQFDLLRCLSRPDGNVCVVGDPDQSIYGFRGAEIRNILDFEEHYPKTVVVRLETNYRSTKTILRAAGSVIENNVQRKHKTLRTDNEEGDLLTRFRATGPAEEAGEIADQIAGRVGDGVSHDQIAVFYRAHHLSRALEQGMKERGIPYEIVGGLSFFERREIKDLLAFLRVLVNPLDDVSMDRVLNVPPRGIGKATRGKLIAAAAEHEASLYEAVMTPEILAGLSPRARKSLGRLAEVLGTAGRKAREGAHPALHTIIDGVEYMGYATGLGDPEDISREENIIELANDVLEFDQKIGEGLAGYLQHVSLLTSADRDAEEGPAVSLMTVHAAKGLEFDHVFVAGLEEGIFPSMRTLEEKDGLEEERRLMYVALTRGRKALWLSHCRERMVGGVMQRMAPSRFFKEVPGECLTEHQQSWHSWEQEEFASTEYADPDYSDAIEGVELQAGSRVGHEEFGTGVVQRVWGLGMTARAAVLFEDGVERTLILEYTKLRPLSGGEAW